MEIAAVSTAAGDSDATVSALGWYGSWHENGHGKGKNREKGKGKEKTKVKERKGRRKAMARATTTAGMSNLSSDGLNSFVATVDTVGKWGVESSLSPVARTSPDGTWCNGFKPVTFCCL